MDFLDPLLASLQADAWLYCLLRGGPPWGLRIPASDAAAFHSVRSGRCWVKLAGDGPIALQAGDFAVLPGGDEHRVLDDPESDHIELLDAISNAAPDTPSVLQLGEPSTGAELVCGGFLLTGPGPNPLRGLPRVVVIRSQDAPRRTLTAVLEVTAGELASPQMGSGTVIRSLGLLVLVEALRSVRDHLPAGGVGLLAAARDDRVSTVLSAIHHRPEHPWTVEELADLANTSRSTISARFRALMGTSVAAYLADARMARASVLLRDTDLSLERIAKAVGYSSDAAFGRAFKRLVGTAPGAHRQLRATNGIDDAEEHLPPLLRAAMAERAQT